jgi:glycosyltransferase involved in cell wall biosynthesis
MNTLVFVTSQFPFGTGESFIESEFGILTESFEKVFIISQNVSHERTRQISEKVKVCRYNPSTSLSGFLYLPILILLNTTIIFRLLREECLFRRISGSALKIGNLAVLFKKIIKSIQLRNYIRKILLKENIDHSILFYSYWLKTGAHAIALLNYEESLKISRAHGSEIYEEKTKSGYLPLLRFSALNLDAIFFISKNGKEYFEAKIRMKNANLFVSYLGVTKPDFEIPLSERSEKFVIVSCSNMVPLKRIDLIVYALGSVKSGRKIKWLHFGDGILKNDIEMLARERLGSSDSISYSFMGHYPNDKLMNFYCQNRIDLFLNTSSTEGIPVSIMEAQCFGIPVIATDTGGVRELVTRDTGTLLPVDFHPDELAREIEYYSNLEDEVTEKIRMNASANWNLNFNASSNYSNFLRQVNSIFVSRKKRT